MVSEIFINGNPIEAGDWVGAFNGDVCVGSRQWDTADCGGGICDVPAMGFDGAEYTQVYMVNGDIPTFNVYDSSMQEYFDMDFYNDDIRDVDWENSKFIYIDLLMNQNPSFNPDGNFENTATMTMIFEDDIYQMGANDVLIGYVNNEIRSVSVSSQNIPPTSQYEHIFYSTIYLNETANELSFKYFNNAKNLIFNTSQTFSNIDSDDSFGNANSPIELNVMCEWTLDNFDCDGNCLLDLDCAGICGGNTVLDECGICGGLGGSNQCGCSDILDGFCDCDGNVLDECGICGGNGTEEGYDCNGLELGFDSIELLNDFMIINSYPNPFNPILNIDFNIKKDYHLNISILDLNGEKVDNIFNGYKMKGLHHIQWNGSRFSSGIYFVFIEDLNGEGILFDKIYLIK